jgi:hypothetical protein
MIGTNYVVPLVAVTKPYRGFQRKADPGLMVRQVEKSTFRRDRECRSQAGFGEKRESFSQCYTRLLQLQDSKYDTEGGSFI